MFKLDEILKATSGVYACGRVNSAVEGVSIDTRTIKPKDAFIALKGNNFDGHDFIGQAVDRGAGIIIAERSCKRLGGQSRSKATIITVKDTLKALGDVARLQREKFDIPVIAVTGSNGKTTTKEMIARVLSGKLKVLKNEGTKNNQIGMPMTLLSLDGSFEAAVLEIGTNHFGEVGYLAGVCLPNVGVITNIAESHLEFFGDLRGVFKEKCTLLNYLKNPRVAVLNSDDKMLKRKTAAKVKGLNIFGVGIENQGDFCASGVELCDNKIKFLVNKKFKFVLNTSGYYNIYNALDAIAVGRIFGLGYKDIAGSLANFNFPSGRLGFIELNNIKFIDDTYNSNPLSLRQALEALDNLKIKGRKIFVMGDMLELGISADSFHLQAGKKIAGICDAFITVGRLSRLSARAAKSAGFNVQNIFSCESSSEARNILFDKISPNPDDIILVKGSRSMKMEEVFKI